MKIPPAIFALILAGFSPVAGQVIYSTPHGYANVVVEAAPAAGQTKLTAISATFLNKAEYQGSGSINADFASGSQTITFGGETWDAGQWTGEPYLAYLTNDNGAEEAFLITGHTTDGTVTVATSYDLSSPPATVVGYPEAVEVRLRKANTLGSLFGAQVSNINPSDAFYLWNGAWSQFSYSGSSWVVAGDPFSDQSDTVVFPEEGVFIQRTQTTPLTFRFFGEVPSKVQTATFANAGIQFVSNRYPVPSTLGDQNIDGLADWQNNADSLYLWQNDAWAQFTYDGTAWRAAGNPFSDAGTTVVEANTAMIISRGATSPAQTNQSLPYDPAAE